ncbi:hypothetical protein [Micromonospora aurantiaca (nom. illeg.)]|uniref:hypothetical protein n=1 Tax=Micromonospora aurantiaca (nom. illeg.) TaxID=47850 RepID=UPI0033DBBD5D
MADKRDILIRLLGEETVARMADRAGDGLDRFGKSLDATERDAQDLDRQIADVDDSLKQLAVAFARTSDAADRMDISKAMRRQQTELRKLTKARDLLPDMEKEGTEAASGFAASFVARVGPLLARAPVNPAGAAIGGALAAGLVPTLSGVIAGAVVGGVGIGGVAGGLALAAKDSRVQAAGKQLADIVGADLEESGGRFVGPAIDGLEVLRDAWNDVSDDIDATLAASSRYVVPLARGVADFVREITPGIRQAAEAAGPIIREIGQGLPRLGRAISDVLEDFSENADEGASAMRWLFMVIEGGIRVVGGMINTFAGWYRALLAVDEVAVDVADHLWGWIPGMGEGIDAGRKRIEELRGALDGSGESGEKAGDNIFGGLKKVEDGAAGAASEVRSLKDILDDFANKTLDARAANREFEAAIDAATESVKENGRTLDTGTAKGRANQQQLDELVRTTQRKSAATLQMTQSQEKANAVTEQGKAAFIRAATAMGMEAGQARSLAAQLFAIPNVNRTVSVQTKSAEAAIRRVQAGLGKVNSKDIRIGVYYTTKGDLKLPGGTQLKGLSGGGPVTGPGAKGVDSQVRLLAPGEHVLTAAEVDAAGGHAGVERIRSVLRGQGGQAPAMAMSGGGGASVVNQYSISVSVPAAVNPAEVGRQVVEAIRAYERGSGKGWRTA